MVNETENLTAYCGLYCGDCLRYRSRVIDLSSEIVDELEKAGFKNYARVKGETVGAFKSYNDCVRVLEAMAGLKCERSCREGGGCGAFECTIIACCKAKGFPGCWECADFENCSQFEFLKPFHGDTPQNNLGKIKKLGIQNWAKERGKFYRWQE
jgi:hypothetical protein